MKLKLLALLFTFNTFAAFADEVEVRPLSVEAASDTLPVNEKAFVHAINKFNKKAIIEQLGEPAKMDDVKLKGTDTVVASIWHYHHINTAEDGSYYPTTELDFVEDKVVQVVFLNNDGSENADGQKYDVPQGADPQPAPNNELGDGVPMINMDETK